MDSNYSLLAILIGLAVRLALPIAITLIAVYLLRKLDAHWQKQAENELAHPLEETETWDLKDCPIEMRSDNPVATSSLPCWQTHRLANGYLNDECLACEVFRDAPARMPHAHAHV
jgi:hypothetical protein